MAKRAVPENAARRIRREQALQALSLLEEGAAWHAGNPYWWIERANIALNTADNPEEAAACYRRAAALPGAPYLAARIHAELLLRLGRRGEAYVWLCRLHPSLPPNIPSAQSGKGIAKNQGAGEAAGAVPKATLPPARCHGRLESRRSQCSA
jgi:hypothetical protein